MAPTAFSCARHQLGNHYFNDGDDRYFRWAVYVDPSTTVGGSFSNPWRALVAWPSVQDGSFSPMKYFLQREVNGSASNTGPDTISFGGNDLGQMPCGCDSVEGSGGQGAVV